MSAATWPGFVTEPCADCGCPGDVHQPVCVGIVERWQPVRIGTVTVAGIRRREYCGCPAYRAVEAQQVGLFGGDR